MLPASSVYLGPWGVSLNWALQSCELQRNKNSWWSNISTRVIVLMQKSTHWNPRASVRQARKSQPSVPVNLTWNLQERKQSQIRGRIGWDSEYLSDGRIGKLCRKHVINERIDRISQYTKRQNRIWTADCVCMIRSKLRMCNSDDVKLKTNLNRLLR